MDKFCVKRQDLIIETKVHILERIQASDPKRDQESISLLFWLFDLLPTLGGCNQCSQECPRCRFPHCPQAKPIMDILRAARDTRFLQDRDANRCHALWESWHLEDTRHPMPKMAAHLSQEAR